MASRSNARYLAPLALITFAVVFLVVFFASGGGGESSVENVRPARSTPARSGTAPAATTTPAPATQRVYTVGSGDILSTIAEKTGVSVERIQQLNPDVDPQALVAGQKLKLRP